MAGNGNKEDTSQEVPAGVGLAKRVRPPQFEKDLLSAGGSILASLPTAVFRDEQALNDACLYLGWLEMHDLQDEIIVALWKINGTPAIDGRARDEAVQAHVGIFFPRNASKEDKQRLEKIQYQKRKDETESNNGQPQSY